MIVCGETTLNALYLEDESFHLFLLGGVKFNVALLSCMAGPFRVINNPDGVFMYNDSDSTEINDTEKVKCYMDYVYGERYEEPQEILKDKYFKYDDLEEYSFEVEALIDDLKMESLFLKIVQWLLILLR